MARGPTFDPGDNRRISRREYVEGRRMARLLAHLRPIEDYNRRWFETVERLKYWPGATEEDLSRLLADALEAGRCSTVSSLTVLEETAVRYMAGNRFCAVCGRLAPLRDDECPDCCH